MSSPTGLKGVVAGAGYFSVYHLDGWSRIPEVEITALCNRTLEKGEARAREFGIPNVYSDFTEMLDDQRPDFVDIVTAPATHRDFCRAAAERGVHIVCQKQLAPTYDESQTIVSEMSAYDVRFMVHENWRWQPWYRETKRLLVQDVIGEPFTLSARMRMGDGWPEDAYLERQPFFREYPRMLVFETGVHFIDTYRYLFGEVASVYARLDRRNPAISGEDSGVVHLGFRSGVTAVWDGSRYNEADTENPRYTFGELRLDASKGHLELRTDGTLWVKPLAAPVYQHHYHHEDRGFAGDCCYRTERHFVDCLLSGDPFESTGEDYLKTLKVVEACYESAQSGQVVTL